jgi:uncharacterized membrane protein YfcA
LEFLYIIGLFLSLIIGIVLGLVGGGGAVLTIPLVVYLFGESTDTATTYSLVIVACSSLVGVLQRIGTKQVSYKEALLFVFPSMTLAFLIRRYRKMVIPQEFELFGNEFTRDFFIDVLLVIVMLIVAYRMLISYRQLKRDVHNISTTNIMLLGLLTGALSGFLGAGGGFIIVPILLGVGIETKRAIGTSLFIIAVQSFIALLGDFSASTIQDIKELNWILVFFLTILSIVGVFIGTLLQRKISGKILRKIFAAMLVVLAVLIFIDRILLF